MLSFLSEKIKYCKCFSDLEPVDSLDHIHGEERERSGRRVGEGEEWDRRGRRRGVGVEWEERGRGVGEGEETLFMVS